MTPAIRRPNPRYRKIMRSVDQKLKLDDASYPVAVVLLAAANVGLDREKIADACGYPLAFVRTLCGKCRTAGIFKGDKICHSGWFDDKTGGVAFWLDVSCILGHLRRSAVRKRRRGQARSAR